MTRSRSSPERRDRAHPRHATHRQGSDDAIPVPPDAARKEAENTGDRLHAAAAVM
jgi:hypothetical protein